MFINRDQITIKNEKKINIQICLTNGLNSSLPLNGKITHLYGAINGGNVKY